MIYATVGTMFLDFPRLIRALDEIARNTGEQIIVQTGIGETLPQHCEHFDFKSHDEIMAIQRDARVIVSHAGIGCVRDALEAKRPLLVVPRRRIHNEHMNDHQLDLARAVESRAWGRMLLDIADLADACANPPPIADNYIPDKQGLIDAIRADIELFTAVPASAKRPCASQS